MNSSSTTALPSRTHNLDAILARLLAQATQAQPHTVYLFEALHVTVNIDPHWTRVTLSQKTQPVLETQFLAILSRWPLRPTVLTTPRLVYGQVRDIHLVITEYPTLRRPM